MNTLLVLDGASRFPALVPALICESGRSDPRQTLLMFDLDVVLQASHTGGGSAMPEWMKRMHAVVEASQARRAVRLFLVKVVVHVERRHAEREAAGQQAANSPGPASPQVTPHY